MTRKEEAERAYREAGWGEAAAELATLKARLDAGDTLGAGVAGSMTDEPTVTLKLTRDQARAILSYVQSAAGGLYGADRLRTQMGRETKHQGRIEMLQGIVKQLTGQLGQKERA